ncbi:hypothetical protein CEUSTIGMA_g3348.t1 [Chlamydomonas eustigma]|uniref:Peroxisomal membrane protein MPV17 n=1 Tax=Chlamydomonas eustigma TaxID=1157962 RepID=A0A250WYP7_9CHLO|nr:hypothetical protein CEUSTIGMA_g3348.t1 [Chlamydomonas eustigma]|eukprot:GAX75905.1 hypothetical protein CEUSTIGMA_g3348.t1 [Chlamydomonas eustigma]
MLRQVGLAFKRIGLGYNRLAEQYPQATAIITTVVKTSAADAFAQKVIEGRKEMDWRRHGMFCVFGYAYLGVWQYYLYNTLFQRWCASITKVVGHQGSASVKTLIDQGIHHPFIYFPAFYLWKGVLENLDPLVSLERCWGDMWVNLKALWMVWIPAQMLNFTYVPGHLRIPFVAAVSFGWTVIISVLRGALPETEPSNQKPLEEI